MTLVTLLTITTTVLASIVSAGKQCYSMQGTALGDSFTPCDPDAAVSACCQLNYTVPDVCLGNGLCMSIRDDYAGTIWADGCTDNQGNERACPQICAGKVEDTDYWSVLQCPEQGSWCCRAFGDLSSCCNDTSRLVSLRAADVTPQLAALSTDGNGTTNSTESSGTVNSTASSTATTAPTDSSVEKAAVNTGLVSGVVGGILGVAFLITLVAAILLWRQNKRLKESAKGYGATEYNSSSNTAPASQYFQVSDEVKLKPYPQPYTNAVEVDSTPNRNQYTSELDGTTRRA